jgi:hypothetical protein
MATVNGWLGAGALTLECRSEEAYCVAREINEGGYSLLNLILRVPSAIGGAVATVLAMTALSGIDAQAEVFCNTRVFSVPSSSTSGAKGDNSTIALATKEEKPKGQNPNQQQPVRQQPASHGPGTGCGGKTVKKGESIYVAKGEPISNCESEVRAKCRVGDIIYFNVAWDVANLCDLNKSVVSVGDDGGVCFLAWPRETR